MRRLTPAFLCLLFATSVLAQPRIDSVFTWRTYNVSSVCRVRIYSCPAGDPRVWTVLIDELAESRGPGAVSDAAHLAELVGRRYGIDPVRTYWIFHWGAFSFANADPSIRKELYLRATFRRNKTGNLSSAAWKVLSRDELLDLIDGKPPV